MSQNNVKLYNCENATLKSRRMSNKQSFNHTSTPTKKTQRNQSIIIRLNPSLTVSDKNVEKTVTMNSIYTKNAYETFFKELAEAKNTLPTIDYKTFLENKPEINKGTIGKYTQNALGMGGFNNTYKIEYANGETYVLRLTHTDVKKHLNSELYGLFVQSYLQKKCPNHICKVYDFGKCVIDTNGNKTDGVYGLIEYLPIICEKHMIPNNDCKYIVEFEERLLHKVFIGLFTALECISINHFAHLDIKSENIGFDVNRNAKLFDFGMARYFPINETCVNSGITGSRLYMDYNSISLKQLCLQSDVWSAGILLYQAWHDESEYSDCVERLLENINNNIIKSTRIQFALKACVEHIKTVLKDHTKLKLVSISPDYCNSQSTSRTEIYALTENQIYSINKLILDILSKTKEMDSGACLKYYITNINNGSITENIQKNGGKKRANRRTTRKCTSNKSRNSRRCRRK